MTRHDLYKEGFVELLGFSIISRLRSNYYLGVEHGKEQSSAANKRAIIGYRTAVWTHFALSDPLSHAYSSR